MGQIILYLLIYVFGLLTAFMIYFLFIKNTVKSYKNQKPVIGIFSGVVHDQELIKRYQEKAIPLANKAGLQYLAGSDSPVILEGDWPHPGFVVVEKFSSMEALQEYQSSPAYLEAKAVRDRAATMNFVIAVDCVYRD